MQLEVISKTPTGGEPKLDPLLFIHGLWHGAWCWDVHFLDYFAAQGYHVHAVSLRGHGKSAGREKLRWWRVKHYVEDVAQVARSLPAPPIVIGHSMGGLVVQRYLEKYRAPAGILVASVPPRGVIPTALRFLRHHPLQFLKINLKMSMYPTIETPELTREVLFSPTTPAEIVNDTLARLQDDSYMTFLDMMLFGLPKPTRVNAPLLVLGGQQDGVISPQMVRDTAHSYRTEPIMFEMGHNLMTDSGWEAVAQTIAQWLQAGYHHLKPPE